jgi:cytochrome bd-type quinol oxidase subunit 1
MTTYLPLSTATGKLFADRTNAMDPLKLDGTVEFELSEEWGGETVKFLAEAIIEDGDTEPYYRLNIGGLRGILRPQNATLSGGPRYVGTLGPHGEMYVQGWLRDECGRWPRHIYLTIVAGGNTGVTEAVEPAIAI